MAPEFFGVLRLLPKKDTLCSKLWDPRPTPQEKRIDHPLKKTKHSFSGVTLAQSDRGAEGCTQVNIVCPYLPRILYAEGGAWGKSPQAQGLWREAKGFLQQRASLLLKDTFGGCRSPSKLSRISFSPPSSPLCPTQLSYSLSPILSLPLFSKHPSLHKSCLAGSLKYCWTVKPTHQDQSSHICSVVQHSRGGIEKWEVGF